MSGVLAPGSKAIMEIGPEDEAKAARLFADTEAQANRVRAIFERWSVRRSAYVRGKESGRIDPHILYRGGLGDARVFKRREALDKLDLGLGIMLDHSSSINDVDWDTILHIGAAFIKALGHRADVDVLVAGYVGVGAVEITRLYDPANPVYRCGEGRNANGSTPSGEALAVMREVILKRFTGHREKIILHVTDGQPDRASPTQQEREKCERAGIPVGCIAVGGLRLPLTELAEVYGKRFRVAANYEDLPEVMEVLLGDILEAR